MFNNPLQLFQTFCQAQNPMGMMSQMLGNNPMFQQAMKLAEGKGPQDMADVVKNIAKQQNISTEQLSQMASQFNLKI